MMKIQRNLFASLITTGAWYQLVQKVNFWAKTRLFWVEKWFRKCIGKHVNKVILRRIFS